MNSLIRPAITLLLVMTAITGIAYPLVITGIAQMIFPRQAGGSLIERDGATVGSRWIGQNFSSPAHFWGRPSATMPQPYDGGASGGSNLGPSNPALTEAVAARVAALRAADPGNVLPVPVDLVTASASGLDPEISVAAANFQAARVATAHGVPVATVHALIAAHARGKLLGVMGEPRVNVLELNLALDRP